MNLTPLFHDLELAFQGYADQYDQLDAANEQRITYWRYATRPAFDLRYDYLRRSDVAPGVLAEVELVAESVYYAYGFDAQDRIVNESFFSVEDFPQSCIFYTYPEGHTDLVQFERQPFSEGYTLTRVGRLLHPDSAQPLIFAEYAVDLMGSQNRTLESYTFDAAGRPVLITIAKQSDVRIDTTKLSGINTDGIGISLSTPANPQGIQIFAPMPKSVKNQIPLGNFESVIHAVYEYEGDRLLRIVERDPDGTLQPRVLYKAPHPDDTEQSLYESAYVSLRQAILDQIRTFEPNDEDRRMFCIVIDYDTVAGDNLGIALLPQSQRTQWEQEADPRSYNALNFLTFEGAYLFSIFMPSEASHSYIHAMRREDRWDDIRTLINHVARDLNDFDWTPYFEPADDFIVFALDPQFFFDVTKDILGCIPNATADLLRERGYLP